MFFKDFGSKDPTRLFVAGVHGNEETTTMPLLERKSKIGVPPFTELEEKILIGSVSPFIRTAEFNREDLCFTLELPIPHSDKALQIALDILRVIALSSGRSDIIRQFRIKYPEHINEAEENFYKFFKENMDVSFF